MKKEGFYIDRRMIKFTTHSGVNALTNSGFTGSILNETGRLGAGVGPCSGVELASVELVHRGVRQKLWPAALPGTPRQA